MRACQPDRSLPLNSAVKPSGGTLIFSALSSAKAAKAPRQVRAVRARSVGIDFIRGVLLVRVDTGTREDVLFPATLGKEKKLRQHSTSLRHGQSCTLPSA